VLCTGTTVVVNGRHTDSAVITFACLSDLDFIFCIFVYLDFEVAAALKKMKKHKAPGLSGLVAEMIQTTGDIGTQWILDLCRLT